MGPLLTGKLKLVGFLTVYFVNNIIYSYIAVLCIHHNHYYFYYFSTIVDVMLALLKACADGFELLLQSIIMTIICIWTCSIYILLIMFYSIKIHMYSVYVPLLYF